MESAKSESPAPTTGAAGAADAFEPLRKLVTKIGDQRYAEGYRRATYLIALAVGKMDGESRETLARTLDILENELHVAEKAAGAPVK